MIFLIVFLSLTGLPWPVLVLAATISVTNLGLPHGRLEKYCRNVWVAEDQKWNAWIFGDEDETLSSRAGKAALNGRPWPARFIDVLVWLAVRQRNHCYECIEWDEGKNAIDC